MRAAPSLFACCFQPASTHQLPGEQRTRRFLTFDLTRGDTCGSTNPATSPTIQRVRPTTQGSTQIWAISGPLGNQQWQTRPTNLLSPTCGSSDSKLSHDLDEFQRVPLT
ncbi:unnamed protein product [Citrullus colocynthis]|uniref:Secreted protein n=1 Tax=Citrullus colocynthis TaxID=252529 RepID=A0ABP0YED8_9ROSI